MQTQTPVGRMSRHGLRSLSPESTGPRLLCSSRPFSRGHWGPPISGPANRLLGYPSPVRRPSPRVTPFRLARCETGLGRPRSSPTPISPDTGGPLPDSTVDRWVHPRQSRTSRVPCEFRSTVRRSVGISGRRPYRVRRGPGDGLHGSYGQTRGLQKTLDLHGQRGRGYALWDSLGDTGRRGRGRVPLGNPLRGTTRVLTSLSKVSPGMVCRFSDLRLLLRQTSP